MTYQSKASEHKLAFLLVFFWALFQPAFAEEPEPPWDGGTIPITGSPWLNCKGLPDPDNNGKPVKGEGGGMPKCGGGGVPPIPGSGNPPGPGDGGGPLPPPLPPELPACDTGDEDIDNTGDLREQLMEQSLQDADLPLEFAALFWPDGEGGYELLEFGVEIPGGGPGTCNFSMPPLQSFPPESEWPEGVIWFHTHPATPGVFMPACNGSYVAGASDSDRLNLAWLRNAFNENIEGMVMDEISIYRYGESPSEDQPPTQRCQ